MISANITHEQIKVHRTEDERLLAPFGPTNRRVELFQTWQLAKLESAVLDPRVPATWARLGFSTTGGPDGGASFRAGQARQLGDPNIAFTLPPTTLEKDAEGTYRLDVHYFEEDGDRAGPVRAAFTDQTLAKLVEVWEKTAETPRSLKAKLDGFLSDTASSVIHEIIAGAGAALAGVTSQHNLMPLVDLLLEAVQKNDVDYHNTLRFLIQLRGTGDNLTWRVVPAVGSPTEWRTGEGTEKLTQCVEDARAANVYDVTLAFRLLGRAPEA